jgi:hypothetical protein
MHISHSFNEDGKAVKPLMVEGRRTHIDYITLSDRMMKTTPFGRKPGNGRRDLFQFVEPMHSEFVQSLQKLVRDLVVLSQAETTEISKSVILIIGL